MTELTTAISSAMADLYARSCGQDHTTATTYINGNVVVCVLEGILAGRADDGALQIPGGRGNVPDGTVAFRTDTEDEFTAAVERLTRQRVVASMNSGWTSPPGVACELFFLAPAVGRAA